MESEFVLWEHLFPFGAGLMPHDPLQTSALANQELGEG